MNKYKKVQPLSDPGVNASHSAMQNGMAAGLRGDIPVRKLPFDAATDLNDVRFTEFDSLSKEYGWTEIGTDASVAVCALNYHFDGTSVYPVRVLWNLAGGPVASLILDYWNGAAWVSVAGSGSVDADVAFTYYASMMTIYGDCLFTMGGIIQRWTNPGGGAIIDLAGAPDAKFIAPFGTRILAFQCNGDVQKVMWCKSGDIVGWTGTGSGELILADVRSDVKDALMGGVQVGAATFAVFRQASIWRAFLTGNATQAIGFTPWVSGVGTESPNSIIAVGDHVGFMGSDKVPYLMTSSGGLIPVGRPIFKLLKSLTLSNLRKVNSGYSFARNEWMITVPSQGITYTFDYGRFVATQQIVWRKRAQNGLLASDTPAGNAISGWTNELWFAVSTETFRSGAGSTDKAGVAFTGDWTSRPLNNTNLATITELLLTYTTPSNTTITVKVSGDGGQTWRESKTVTLTATTLKDAIVNTGFNTTGSDLRFKIEFDQTVACEITGYLPVIVERGTFDYNR